MIAWVTNWLPAWGVAQYNYRYGKEEGVWVSFPRVGFWFEFGFE
jgi:hypothetical protein